MKLKLWIVTLVASAILAACGNLVAQPVARVDNVTLSRQEVDQRVDRIDKALKEQGAQQGMTPVSRTEIEQNVVQQFVDQNLVLSLARQRSIAISDKEVDDQIEKFRASIKQQSGMDLDKAIQDQLGFAGANSSEFRQFVSFILAQGKLSESLVTPESIRQQVTTELMAETKKTILKATVAHILVDTEDEAKQALARLDKGEKFEDLVKELSKDPGSAQTGGVYEDVPRGQFVPEFEKAMFEDLQPGQTTAAPVKTEFGYHIIRLISRAEKPSLTEEQAKQMIEQQIDQTLQGQRQEALMKLIDEERAKAEKEQRLQQPIYPTPTRAAIPEQPVQPQSTPAPAP